MKHKLFLLIFAFSFFSVPSFAQENNLKIQIFLKDSKILTTNKNVPVKVKITNKSEQALNTKDLGNLFLYFSKCRKDEMCYRQDDLLFASVEIKSKILKKNESIEFESSLGNLIWIDQMSSFRFDRPNFYILPKENIYFYAAIPRKKDILPEGTRLPEDFLSNQITVSLESE